MENVQRRQRRMNETSMAESGEVKYFCMGKAENSFQMIYSQFLGGRKQLMNAPGMSKNSSSTRRKYKTLQNGREVEENCTANNRPKKKEKCTKCEWKLAEKCHQQLQPGEITKKK